MPQLNDQETAQGIEGLTQLITENIKVAAEKSFKQTGTELNMKYNKEWWSTECSQAVARRRRARKMMERHPSGLNIRSYKDASAEARRIIGEQKKRSFKKFCSTLTATTPISQVWNKIKRFQNKSKSFTSVPLIQGNNIVATSVDKADIFRQYFENKFKRQRDICTEQQKQGIEQAKLQINDEYNVPFTKQELEAAVNTLKYTAPGYDNILNQFIRNLNENYFNLLLEVINTSWEEGELPKIWKAALIMPILKPDKMATSVESYRPISLLPCIAKLMEKLVCTRLYWILEKEEAFSKNQSGYRKRVSILEQIAVLEKCIKEAYLERKICLTVFVDLEGAFDSINHTMLLHKLVRGGVRGKMLRWLASFMRERTFEIYYNGETSTKGQIYTGVPQGSILSPVLFNAYLSDIPVMANTIQTEYADDLALSVKGENMAEAIQKMQASLNILYAYTHQNGLKISYSKTKAMIFTNKRYAKIPLYINNNKIGYVDEFKYLGMTLDSPHLTWRKHIDRLKEKSNNRINTMKAVSHHQWGADRTILCMMYRALV